MKNLKGVLLDPEDRKLSLGNTLLGCMCRVKNWNMRGYHSFRLEIFNNPFCKAFNVCTGLIYVVCNQLINPLESMFII